MGGGCGSAIGSGSRTYWLPSGGTLAGHGLRDGQAVIATLRWRLIRIPARLVRHAHTLTLRPPPGYHLLEEILARLRALLTQT